MLFLNIRYQHYIFHIKLYDINELINIIKKNRQKTKINYTFA